MGVLNSVGLWLGLRAAWRARRSGCPVPGSTAFERSRLAIAATLRVTESIVFVGSSSFTLWSSLEADMAPLPAVNRGFGGALIDDVVRSRIASSCRTSPRPSCSSPAPTTSRGPDRHRPTTLPSDSTRSWPRSVSSSPMRSFSMSRYAVAARAGACGPLALEANRLIEARVRSERGARFIDLGPFLLGRDGTPDPRFYRRDGLHPSKRGYRIWAREIAASLRHEPALMQKLGVSG